MKYNAMRRQPELYEELVGVSAETLREAGALC